jgi:hypothetical protein
METVLQVAGLEFLMFLIITVNFRAVAKGWIKTTVATDCRIASLGFTLMKLVVEAKTVAEMLGYVTGAGLGSVCGMWLTRRWREEGMS